MDGLSRTEGLFLSISPLIIVYTILNRWTLDMGAGGPFHPKQRVVQCV